MRDKPPGTTTTQLVSQQQASPRFYDDQVKLAQRFHDRGLDYCYGRPQRLDLALEHLEKALQLRESLLGKYHNDTALSFFRKACVLREFKKDYLNALIIARREIRATQHLLGNLDRPVVNSQSTHQWLAERIQWFQEVLIRAQPTMSEQDIVKYSSQLLEAMEYERLGDLHCRDRQWHLAITQYNCAITLESSAYAKSVLEIADLQVKIGDAYAQMGDDEAAIEEYQRAHDKYLEEFGSSPHSRVGQLMDKCATIYMRQKDFNRALGTYAKVYSIFEHVYGVHHPIVVDKLQDIRLVTVKEMEELRRQEYQKLKELKREQREARSDSLGSWEHRSIF
eukprot:Nitzschia sp. Nitz4//scaffold275_size25065//23220//24230//NITZ4_008336-RA/size25065-processed-gene-0.6-mRNA-1//1//CDS//3329545309//1353//frame0